MAKRLTAAAAVKMKPGRERIEVLDATVPGLYLVIYPGGRKSFAMKFRRPTGELARLTLGYFDPAASDAVMGGPLTLAGARRVAAEINHQRATGVDVIGARQRMKLERQARGDATFAQAAKDFVEQHLMRNTRRWQEQARFLGVRTDADGNLEIIPKSVTDRWASRPIGDITGDDVHGIVDEAIERGVPGTKRRNEGPSDPRGRAMIRVLSRMGSWLTEKRRLSTNFCDGVYRPKAPPSRERVLTDEEVNKFWIASGKLTDPFGPMLKLLLLTGCRLNEVAGMRRSELSGDEQLWTIPGSRTKNKRTHVVPLAPLAREVLRSVHTEGELVFTTNRKTPVSGFSKMKRRLDTAMGVTGWRLHDLRRTCATGMAEIGVEPHIVEAALNHVSGAKASVAGVYNRAEYRDEKKLALSQWAAHVAGITSRQAAKVVPMRQMAS